MKTTKAYLKATNERLSNLGAAGYYPMIPVRMIIEILEQFHFDAVSLYNAIFCGREGRIHEQVADNAWLTLSWYKHETGRFEVTAYVN